METTDTTTILPLYDTAGRPELELTDPFPPWISRHGYNKLYRHLAAAVQSGVPVSVMGNNPVWFEVRHFHGTGVHHNYSELRVSMLDEFADPVFTDDDDTLHIPVTWDYRWDRDRIWDHVQKALDKALSNAGVRVV